MTQTETSTLVPLGDARAADPSVVGAKAASLAAALRRGLPVPPGFVVPVAASRSAIAAGSAALAAGNPGSAHATVTRFQPDTCLDAMIAEWAGRLRAPLVARSSATVEGDGAWSGAFASYAELGADDVSRAVRGCWASLFTRDALERAQSVGLTSDEVGMAVLIQQEIVPARGGVADTDATGSVRISWIDGPPAAIVAGWARGRRAVVDTTGTVSPAHGDPAVEESMRRAADLARRARAELGCDRIEWAETNDTTWLLQAAARAARPDTASGAGQGLHLDGGALEVARLLTSYPGPVGERYVVSWALGLDPVPEASGAPPVDDLEMMLAEATILAGALAQVRWDALGEEAVGRVRATLVRLGQGADPAALLPSAVPDPAMAGGLLHLLDAIADRLVALGRLRHRDWLWHLETDELARLVGGGASRAGVARRSGKGRWEALVHAIVSAAGRSEDGEASAPGWGAGALRLVRDAGDAATVPPRAVVAAVYPLPNLAPLLWDAAGLVTAGGSPGAHLFEVASSLGVPAVCGVDLEAATGSDLQHLRGRTGILAAVDGSGGSLTCAPPRGGAQGGGHHLVTVLPR